MTYFDEIKALVPWLTDIEASKLLNDFEDDFFSKNPALSPDDILSLTAAELKQLEEKQNSAIIKAFKTSPHVRRN